MPGNKQFMPEERWQPARCQHDGRCDVTVFQKCMYMLLFFGCFLLCCLVPLAGGVAGAVLVLRAARPDRCGRALPRARRVEAAARLQDPRRRLSAARATLDTGKQGQHNINKTLPLLARSWCAQTKIVELLYCTTLVHSSARVCSRFLASGVPVAVCLFGRLNGCLRYDESSSNVRLSGAIRGGLSTVCLDGFKCPQGSSCRSVRLFFWGKHKNLLPGEHF